MCGFNIWSLLCLYTRQFRNTYQRNSEFSRLCTSGGYLQYKNQIVEVCTYQSKHNIAYEFGLLSLIALLVVLCEHMPSIIVNFQFIELLYDQTLLHTVARHPFPETEIF